jgi:hypothetical protein
MGPMIAIVGMIGLGVRTVTYLLCLRWQSRQEEARRRSLARLADQLTSPGRLEEVRADGSTIRVWLGSEEGSANHHG